MIIAIKSEMDSRVLLYPLIRVLNTYGSLCVISSNRQLHRLIDDDNEGGFRDIRVIVEEDGGVDSVYAEYGIVAEDFDFIVLDNMGAMEYNVLVVPMGEVVSESFQEEIDLLKTDVNVRFVKFGGSKRASRTSRDSRDSKLPRRRRNEDLIEEALGDELDDSDPADKFRTHQDIDKEYNVAERFYNCAFISYQEIEDMESKRVLPKAQDALAGAFYEMFKDKFAIDRRAYDKNCRMDDYEYRGAVSSVKADIDSPPKRNRRER